MSKIKISLIGLGMAGRRFHASLSTFEDTDLSICDLDEERLQRAGDEFKTPLKKRYRDYHKMLACEKPDAVIVAIAQYPTNLNPGSPGTYEKIVTEMLDRKINIMVEKPLAMDIETGKQLAARARKAGVVNMVNVNRRFNPLLNFCLERVRERGPVITANCHFYKGKKIGVNDTCDWLTADMIHALDLLRHINTEAEITSFHGSVSRLNADKQPSGFYALAEFDSGSTGIFSSNVRVGVRKELWQIHGLGISAYIETALDQINDDRLVKAKIYRDDNFLSPREYWDYNITGSDNWLKNRGFYYSDRYFIDCVKNNKAAHCDFADEQKTVALCHDILDNKELEININEYEKERIA